MYLCSLLYLPAYFLLLLFMWIWITALYPLISACKTRCRISCRAGLLVTNFPHFYLSGYILISCCFFKIVLLNLEVLVDCLFLFALWLCKPIAFCLPRFLVIFSLDIFKLFFFFIFDCWQFEYDMSRSGSLWVYLT